MAMGGGLCAVVAGGGVAYAVVNHHEAAPVTATTGSSESTTSVHSSTTGRPSTTVTGRSGSTTTTGGAVRPSGSVPPTTSPDATLLSGAAGVPAPWVVAENQRPGTTAWQIADKPPGTIAGFADHASAAAGDTVQLYVSTDAPSFSVQAYRMGYYGGAGGRLVWTSAPVAGMEQLVCPVEKTTNMVSCDDWTPSLSLTISPLFVPGDYLLKLVGSGGQQSYVPLTVDDPTSHATYLVENDIYTWQAWNPYGGYDFYAGEGKCPSGVYPICSRARVVSFDRPYGYGQGAADFLGNEYPLIRFMEQNGLDVTYATSADFETDPSMLLQHRALLSLGHDECWSYDERLATVAAEQHGINMIFFGASPMLRHVRLEESPLGLYRQEVDYRDSAADPIDGTGEPRQVTGNTWSDRPANWSEVPFVGANYTGYVRPDEQPVPYRVYDGNSWLFTGTGLQTGSEIPGLLVSDFDQFDRGVSPRNVEILAHSPMPLSEVQTNVRSPASDTTYYTDPASGAGVFDTGTVTWIPDIASSPVVGQMTANLLALFGTGPAGKLAPSTANWMSLY
jgi:hypothetical protein